MKIHHLNCGTMCPVGLEATQGRLVSRFVCHVLLIETRSGLVLVDTGLGTRDVDMGFGVLFDLSCRPRYELAEAALPQLKAMGFDHDDVRHIVLTHLDKDHAGGLSDFPRATVHVHATEREVSQRRNLNGWLRYDPRHWSHDVSWQTYDVAGDDWFGFKAVRELAGVPEEILLIPLPGHSLGHCGVAVDTGQGWLLHCGDAFFHRAQIDPSQGEIPMGIKLFQNTMVADRRARNHNIDRLGQLQAAHSDQIRLFCAHDAVSFDALRDA